MNPFRILYVLIFLCFSLQGNSQSSRLDSFLLQVDTVASDSLKAAMLVREAARWRLSSPDTCIMLAERALAVNGIEKFPREYGVSYYFKALASRVKRDYEQVTFNLEKAYDVFATAKDTFRMAVALNDMCINERQQENYPEALELARKALNLKEQAKLNPKEIGNSYLSIGNIYFSLDDVPAAKEYYQKALENYKKANDPSSVAAVENNIGLILIEEGENEASIPYFKSALAYNDSVGLNVNTASNHLNLGIAYFKMKAYEPSNSHLKQALTLYRELGDVGYLATTLNYLGDLNKEIGNSSQALIYYEEGLASATSIDERQYMMDSYEKMSLLFSDLGNYKRAYELQKDWIQLKDTLFQEEKLEALANAQTAFETERKSIRIDQLETEKIIQNRSARRLTIALIIAGVLALLALYGFYLRNKANAALVVQHQATKSVLKEKEELLEHLQNTQQQLVQSEKMAALGRFTAGIAHEINNPINFISSSVQAIRLDLLDVEQLLAIVDQLDVNAPSEPQVQALFNKAEAINLPFLRKEILDLLESIERGTNRTSTIIQGLQQVSKTQEEAFTDLDVRDCLEDALEQVVSKIRPDIHLEKQYTHQELIKGQAKELVKVFEKIIENAVDAMAEGGELAIKTTETDELITISIKDTGAGLSPDTQYKIFDPFFTTKETGQGIGLGLAISYGIIRRHKGHIEVRSEEGSGSEFLIKLPKPKELI